LAVRRLRGFPVCLGREYRRNVYHVKTNRLLSANYFHSAKEIRGLAIAYLCLFRYIYHVRKEEKPLVWLGSSKKDLLKLPTGVRRVFGHALHFAQHGEQHDAAKRLKGFSGKGVLEVVEDDAAGTYRAVYTVKFEAAVFVLHCFQKKSKRGIQTPKADMDIIRTRLKAAATVAQEMRDGKTKG
jgi:phage-related protein